MPSTAVVHEWISDIGGSENTAEVIADVLDADVFCLWRDDLSRFAKHAVHESPLARSKFLRAHKVAALPLMPAVWRHTDLSAYERIVVSSHVFAHHVGSSKHTRHAQVNVYVYTPARYIWAPDFDHRGRASWVRAAAVPLQRLDRSRVPRHASFATISEFVRRRTEAAWGVESEVIYPPVDVARIQAGMPWADKISPSEIEILAGLPDAFVLGASRFISYKRLEAAVEVGSDLGLPVVLAGAGPDRERLAQVARAAPVPVSFVDRPSTPLLYALYEAASLFVFAPVEDFGIMPVEAMALGTPVLVNNVGGARESVEAIGGGCITRFDAETDRTEAARLALKLEPEAMRLQASRFDTATFQARIQRWVDR